MLCLQDGIPMARLLVRKVRIRELAARGLLVSHPDALVVEAKHLPSNRHREPLLGQPMSYDWPSTITSRQMVAVRGVTPTRVWRGGVFEQSDKTSLQKTIMCASVNC